MDYPLWNLFLTMLCLFIWIMLIFLVFGAAMNIFRSRSLSGGGIVRGAQLAGEQIREANGPQDEAFRRHERFEAWGKRGGDELTGLAASALGVITDTKSREARPRS